MSGLYSKPLRVYIVIGFLAIWGIIAGLQLPISLFPKSSQASVAVNISYGQQTAQQFFDTFGGDLEYKLQNIIVDKRNIEEMTADYSSSGVYYKLQFPWGVDPEEAKKSVESTVYSAGSNMDDDIRRSISVYTWKENQGFYAASFYSSQRSLDQLYEVLQPFVSQISAKVSDASEVELYNPTRKEIRVLLSPEKLATFKVSTRQVQIAIQNSLQALSGGSMKLGDKNYSIFIPKTAASIEFLKQIPVSDPNISSVLLKDVADVSITPSDETRQKFKTSGIESLILFADPKEGGNIKNMSDDISRQIDLLKAQWPKDIEFKVLVNPAEFINRSILGVVREVALAAFLAVVVLFLFIGSLKNVITAAIEIPLSLLMAFIMMKLTNMNLNLISLGGLALSAGMNVDASVVVMENIFRYFEKYPDQKTSKQRLALVVKAVNEVKLPIIASTIASLVVFMPLIMTQGLTNSLLGDLAKAVVFSHGLSAIVALVLVPTIRLQLMKSESNTHFVSPIEKPLRWIENFYTANLSRLLTSRNAQVGLLGSLVLILVLLTVFVTPRLKKEIIGKPETDWLMVGFNSPLFNSIKQVDAELEVLENDLFEKFGDKINYTFTQVNGKSSGMIMVRLKSRKDIEALQKKAEETYINTPTLFYWVDRWNPSELRIPDPPHFRAEIVGGTVTSRMRAAEDLRLALNEAQIFPRLRTNPEPSKDTSIRVSPHLGSLVSAYARSDLTHYMQTATNGTWVSYLPTEKTRYPIYLRVSKERVQSLEQLKALPISIDDKILPLSALAQFSFVTKEPNIYRENQKALVYLSGKKNESEKQDIPKARLQATKIVEDFKKELEAKAQAASKTGENVDLPSITIAETDKDLNSALTQLKWAILISIALIFLTMVIQFGDIIHALLVLAAIPFGFLGVLISLFVFGSSLSLNSGLGTILLNGIAVANSIILVDFMKRLFDQGMRPREAALEAARARLRPILMTSMTTVLGMFPIALGMGEGGKILQPLGIAVCGGLWVSMLLTLFFVPTLQYLYLNRLQKSPKYKLAQMQFLENDLTVAQSSKAIGTPNIDGLESKNHLDLHT